MSIHRAITAILPVAVSAPRHHRLRHCSLQASGQMPDLAVLTSSPFSFSGEAEFQ